jgi:hypothetical protein
MKAKRQKITVPEKVIEDSQPEIKLTDDMILDFCDGIGISLGTIDIYTCPRFCLPIC